VLIVSITSMCMMSNNVALVHNACYHFHDA
jgi:hypothetical protein